VDNFVKSKADAKSLIRRELLCKFGI